MCGWSLSHKGRCQKHPEGGGAAKFLGGVRTDFSILEYLEHESYTYDARKKFSSDPFPVLTPLTPLQNLPLSQWQAK